MKRMVMGIALASLAAVALADMDQAKEPQKIDPRAWLERQIGNWELMSELAMSAEPGAPRTKSAGQVKSRMLGGNWLISEGVMRFGDEAVTFVRILGYDEQKGRFVGSWVDDVLSHMWTFEGAFEGDTLVLESAGPSCLEPGRHTSYREFNKFTRDGVIQFRSVARHSNGEWIEYMMTEHRRSD